MINDQSRDPIWPDYQYCGVEYLSNSFIYLFLVPLFFPCPFFSSLSHYPPSPLISTKWVSALPPDRWVRKDMALPPNVHEKNIYIFLVLREECLVQSLLTVLQSPSAALLLFAPSLVSRKCSVLCCCCCFLFDYSLLTAWAVIECWCFAQSAQPIASFSLNFSIPRQNVVMNLPRYQLIPRAPPTIFF